jgi:hypothetical protein
MNLQVSLEQGRRRACFDFQVHTVMPDARAGPVRTFHAAEKEESPGLG